MPSTEIASLNAFRSSWIARLLSLPTVLGLALIAMVFVFVGSSTHLLGMNDPDVWWHLGNARAMVQTLHVAHSDAWTFTVGGKPWMDFEWLGELIYFAAWKYLGFRGYYLVMMLLTSGIVAGICYLGALRSGDWKAGFVATFLGLHFLAVSVQPRPLLFGWLFLVIELAILWNLYRGRDATALLPLLFLVWINIHGSWLIGFALMLLFFGGGLVQGEWGSIHATRWTSHQLRKFAWVTAASAGCLFVNPYGWRLVAYPLDVAFRQKGTLSSINEWASLNFHDVRGKLVLATLILLLVLRLVRNRRWPLQDLIFFIIAVYAGFTYVRFVFLMGIIVVPLLAIEMTGVLPPPYDPAQDRRWLNLIAIPVLLAMIVASVPSVRKVDQTVHESYPDQALPYLRSIAGHGNVFNQFNWGAYLAFNVPPMRYFIDSRVDIFVHSGVLDDYVRVLRLDNSLSVLDKYQVQYVLIAPDSPLAFLLEHSPSWKRTYRDAKAVVFERNGP